MNLAPLFYFLFFCNTWSSGSKEVTFTGNLNFSLDKSECYPSLEMNLEFPMTSSEKLATASWWCDTTTEYAWLGFSYDVEDCPSQVEMVKTFTWMKQKKNARYVRTYGACDQPSFNHNLIAAASKAQVGVYALIWFGFSGDSMWRKRKDNLIGEIKKNSLAPYVIKAVTLGSEPLYDGVIDVEALTQELKALKFKLAPYEIPLTISEMTYGFQINNDAPSIFELIQIVSLNVLPVFDTDATTSDKSWEFVKFCIEYGKSHGKGKPVVITQTGWPSNKDEAIGVKAVTDVEQEKKYFDLLNDHCHDFKEQGVGWFSHIYSEVTLSGWGVVLEDGEEKFKFSPLTTC
ncbi:hypothetical protein CROQUDRAFT_40079 [Cronartium quercuum f. sp. fusiforme G11]|uniref:glucan endo-1,3-beta-D-glucosidase n=1 Tax=Cronartium quercuum f. sp. fusiforme G11 TaxID=708437 RepID=A0A9P6TG00_9BASI|nr:hypothetical protein CROQUDRAFT_40079 [Cronartium quercuum f. sp. fusiforme G11]